MGHFRKVKIRRKRSKKEKSEERNGKRTKKKPAQFTTNAWFLGKYSGTILERQTKTNSPINIFYRRAVLGWCIGAGQRGGASKKAKGYNVKPAEFIYL